jgi:thermitase
MRLRCVVFVGAAILAAAGFAQERDEIIPGQALVQFKPGALLSAVMTATGLGAQIENVNDSIHWMTLRLPDNLTFSRARSLLRSKPAVLNVQPNGYWTAIFTPNDPLFGQQFHHAIIQAPQAWDISQGSSNVTVAIIDTGVDLSHPDLAAKIVPGFDFFNNDPDPSDDNGHGTHVAGIAAASTNNGIAVAGVSFDCRIMPVKVLSAGGGGTWDAVANGITFAADNGAHVINLSLGGYSDVPAVRSAINYAWNRGLLICAGAGNDNVSTLFYPAAYPNAIAVGSTDPNDSKSSFSNFGPWVDVAAPGSGILSTTLGGGTGSSSGTSMSSPVAAGVAALIRSFTVGLSTNAEMRGALESSCDNVGNWVAFGRVNAFRALQQAPIFTDVVIPAVGVSVLEGSYASGNVNSVKVRNDGDTFAIDTVTVPRLGLSAASRIDFTTSQDVGSANRLSLQVDATGATGATGLVYLYHWGAAKYVWVKSFPLGQPGAATIDVTVKKPYLQWSNGGQIRMAIRGLAPSRRPTPFTFRIDRAQITLRVRA